MNEQKIKLNKHTNKQKPKSIEDLRKYQAQFIQDYVLYNQVLDSSVLLQRMASSRTHSIIVSNVHNPSNIQVQFSDNVAKLDELMDELEICYCGIGSSSYDMPIEYVQMGRLCAAIYPADNNWHRACITGVHLERKQARVEFIDYGGDSLVTLKNMKFLDKRFAELPVQAVNARFANVRCTKRTEWPKDIINYLLNRVMGKQLTAHVVGFNDGRVSLDIFDETHSAHNSCPKGTQIHLNKRIIMDGFGEAYDEQSVDVDFVDFDTWSKATRPQQPADKADKDDSSLEHDIRDKLAIKPALAPPPPPPAPPAPPAVTNETKFVSELELVIDRNNNNPLSSNNNNNNNSTSAVINVTMQQQQQHQQQQQTLESTTALIKTKKITLNVSSEADDEAPQTRLLATFPLDLVSVNKEIFVFWTQVADLFGLSYAGMLTIMRGLIDDDDDDDDENEEDDDAIANNDINNNNQALANGHMNSNYSASGTGNNKQGEQRPFIKVFKLDAYHEPIFSFVEDAIVKDQCDLIDKDRGELYFVYYKQLADFCHLVLAGDHAKRIRHAIVSAKSSSKKK